MIKTLIVRATDDGTEAPMGWCVFGQMPISIPPVLPGAPPQAQPQAAPVMMSIKGESYIIVGYRWDAPTIDEVDKFNLPEAYLYLVVRLVADLQAAQRRQTLVAAPAGVMSQLPPVRQN